MIVHRTAPAWMAAAIVLLASELAAAQAQKQVKIYEDVLRGKEKRTATEIMFAPFGFMPAERADQISVNASFPIEADAPEKGTCLKYVFEFERPTDWVGAYTLVGGNSWGDKRGVDCQKLLGVDADTQLALRFRAAGEGAVTFKIGGIREGGFPSSLRFAREIRQSPTRLTAEFQEYTIGPIPAGEMTNVIDPFCVVASGLDNRGRDVIRILVDGIRIERFAEAPEKKRP